MKQFYETYRESAFLSPVAREMYSEITNNFKDNYIFESDEALNEFKALVTRLLTMSLYAGSMSSLNEG